MEITFWPRLRDPVGRRVKAPWAAICARLSAPRPPPATKEDSPGFAFATFRDDRRALANALHVHAVGLDIDHDAPAWPVLAEFFRLVPSFLHTTWSSRPEAIRARCFIPLSRPVDAAEYRRVWRAVVDRAQSKGLALDTSTSDPSRLWFLPVGMFLCAVGTGKPIDVEGALRAVPPPAPPAPLPPPASQGDVELRALAYVALAEPAISGSGGHNITFLLAQRLVRGFALDDETAYRVIAEWNQRCLPPWSERELRRKLCEARERGTMAVGSLLARGAA